MTDRTDRKKWQTSHLLGADNLRGNLDVPHPLFPTPNSRFPRLK